MSRSNRLCGVGCLYCDCLRMESEFCYLKGILQQFPHSEQLRMEQIEQSIEILESLLNGMERGLCNAA